MLFQDDFEDGVLPGHWTFVRGTWSESGGRLNGEPEEIDGVPWKALAVATPAFSGCEVCTFETTVLWKNSFGAPWGVHVRVQAWFEDPWNHVALTLRPELDEIELEQKVSGVILSRFTTDFPPLQEGVPYNLALGHDGDGLSLSVNGEVVLDNEGPLNLSGTFGIQVRHADIEVFDVLVSQ